MPDVPLPTWLEWLLVLGVVAGAMTAIAKAWTGVVVPYLVEPLGRVVGRELEKVIEDHLMPIRHELHTNGGSSLKDAVLRIERRLETESEARERHEQYVHTRFHQFANFLTVNNPEAEQVIAELHELLAEEDS